MLKKRLISVLIIRKGQVVQSVRFKHTNVIHYNPAHAIESFNKWAVDEIVILNVDRKPENRELFINVLSDISRHCFVPLSAGGWINDENYAEQLLRNGADKLVLNTALSTNPKLIEVLSKRYGKQCIVISIDAIADDGSIFVAVDRGREVIKTNPVDWALKAQDAGAGEIFFNSINHDGARKGYDLVTLKKICISVEIPVIAFGGVFNWDHLVEGIGAGAAAAAAANIFHYTEQSTKKAKAYMADAGIPVRKEGRF